MRTNREGWIGLALLLGFALPASLFAHGSGAPPPKPSKPPPPVGSPGTGAPAPGGGSNPGPGDMVPTGPGSGGPSAPSTPPSTPGPSGPSTPPTAPPSRGPATPGPAPVGPTTAASTGGTEIGTDPADWGTWWQINQHAFLGLREAIWDPGVATGSDDFFLGIGEGRDLPAELRPSDAQLAERVAPALRRALEREKQIDVLSSSMVALAKLGDTQVAPGERTSLEVLRAFLRNSNQELQETAALCLGILGESAAPMDLGSLLADDARGRELVGGERVPLRTRAFAAYGLGVLAQRSERVDVRRWAAHQIVRALDERNAAADVAVACVNALALVELPSSSAQGARESGNAHPSSSREALVEHLLARLADERLDSRMRAHLPRALVRSLRASAGPETKQVVESLLRIVETGRRGNRDVLRGAIQALGDLQSAGDEASETKVRRALLGAATEADALARPFAMIALAQAATRPGAPSEGAKEAREFLLRALARGESRLRPWAGLALGVMAFRQRELGSEPSRDASLALRAALHDCGSPTELGAYALGLGLAGDIGSSGILLEKLARHSDDVARAQLAIALGLMRERSAAELLRGMLPESVYRPALMRGLAIGLALLGDKGSVPALASAMKETRSNSVRAVYAWTLSHIGDARAIDPMLALLEDQSLPDLTRASAAMGLGQVCERSPEPWNTPLAINSNYPESPQTFFDGAGSGGVLSIW